MKITKMSALGAIGALASLPTTALAAVANPSVVVTGNLAAVPTLSNGLLIALGVLLAVIAMRVMQQGQQKLLSVLILGGGLAAGTLGVDQSVATDAGVSGSGAACNGGVEQASFSDPFGVNSLFNGCKATDLTITGYTGMPCSAATQLKFDGDIGDVVQAGDSVTLNRCPGAPPG